MGDVIDSTICILIKGTHMERKGNAPTGPGDNRLLTGLNFQHSRLLGGPLKFAWKMKTWRGGGSRKSSNVIRGDHFSEVTFKSGIG